MFNHILVPLDGSQRAEQALPLAAHLAHFHHSTIVLLRSVEFMTIYTMQTAGVMEKIQAMEEQAAKDYLLAIKNSRLLEHIPTTTVLYMGEPASAIIEACKVYNIDLIVLFSHGRTGMKRWVLGSVAQKVARTSSVPVLIQRSERPLHFTATNKEPTFRLCVALDGSPQAEAILEPALALTIACRPSQYSEVHLLRIVEPLEPADVEAFQRDYQVDIQNVICQPAQTYINEVAARLRQTVAEHPGITVIGTVKTGVDVAHELIEYTEHHLPDQQLSSQVLAMTTHGRGGLEHWMLGSVAERVLNQTKLPLLIACPQAPHHADQPDQRAQK